MVMRSHSLHLCDNLKLGRLGGLAQAPLTHGIRFYPLMRIGGRSPTRSRRSETTNEEEQQHNRAAAKFRMDMKKAGHKKAATENVRADLLLLRDRLRGDKCQASIQSRKKNILYMI